MAVFRVVSVVPFVVALLIAGVRGKGLFRSGRLAGLSQSKGDWGEYYESSAKPRGKFLRFGSTPILKNFHEDDIISRVEDKMAGIGNRVDGELYDLRRKTDGSIFGLKERIGERFEGIQSGLLDKISPKGMRLRKRTGLLQKGVLRDKFGNRFKDGKLRRVIDRPSFVSKFDHEKLFDRNSPLIDRRFGSKFFDRGSAPRSLAIIDALNSPSFGGSLKKDNDMFTITSLNGVGSRKKDNDMFTITSLNGGGSRKKDNDMFSITGGKQSRSGGLFKRKSQHSLLGGRLGGGSQRRDFFKKPRFSGFRKRDEFGRKSLKIGKLGGGRLSKFKGFKGRNEFKIGGGNGIGGGRKFRKGLLGRQSGDRQFGSRERGGRVGKIGSRFGGLKKVDVDTLTAVAEGVSAGLNLAMGSQAVMGGIFKPRNRRLESLLNLNSNRRLRSSRSNRKNRWVSGLSKFPNNLKSLRKVDRLDSAIDDNLNRLNGLIDGKLAILDLAIDGRLSRQERIANRKNRFRGSFISKDKLFEMKSKLLNKVDRFDGKLKRKIDRFDFKVGQKMGKSNGKLFRLRGRRNEQDKMKIIPSGHVAHEGRTPNRLRKSVAKMETIGESSSDGTVKEEEMITVEEEGSSSGEDMSTNSISTNSLFTTFGIDMPLGILPDDAKILSKALNKLPFEDIEEAAGNEVIRLSLLAGLEQLKNGDVGAARQTVVERGGEIDGESALKIFDSVAEIVQKMQIAELKSR